LRQAGYTLGFVTYFIIIIIIIITLFVCNKQIYEQVCNM